MEFKDYYATLGVAKTASEKEIKQAFRKLARKHHPDVNPGDKAAESRFKEINEAYEVLGDPDKRRKYDELGANWRLYEQAQQQGGQPGQPFGGFQGFGDQGGSWTVNMGGGPRRLSDHDRRGDARALRQRGSVLRFFPHVLRWRRRPGGAATGADGRRAVRRAATSSTRSS